MGRRGRQPQAARGQQGAGNGARRSNGRAVADVAQAQPDLAPEEPRRRGPIGRGIRAARGYLPRGDGLSPEVFRQRHRLLCWILALHVPVLFAWGLWRVDPGHAAMEILTPSACLLFARLSRNRRLSAFFVTAGLVFCSSVIVHLSGGTIEAHFHFFVLIGLIALYQDWVPFVWNVVFTVLSHGLGSVLAADVMFNHYAAQNRPWGWAVIHGVAVLAACVGVIVFWKNTELEQQRNSQLAANLTNAEAEAAQRQSVSELFVNLARRNQTLLDRQLSLIAELEQREHESDALAELFQLDHLATRIRRNAESLLVLSGDNSPRRWGRPVPLGELVRAAAAEVEDYARVDVLVNDYLEVSGRAVADLAHLLAELLENATTFSPPECEVRVRSHLAPGEWSNYVLSIEDTGVGMAPEDMRVANVILADPPEVDLRGSKLGFHVVGRLAKRYGLQVHLAGTPGGGVTALVTLPDGLVSERRQPTPVAAGVALAEATAPTPVVQIAPEQRQRRRSEGGGPTGVWSTSWHLTSESNQGPAASPAPAPSPEPAPVPAGATAQATTTMERPSEHAPAHLRRQSPEPVAGTTADGLVRRVRGASLASGLRRAPEPAGDAPQEQPAGRVAQFAPAADSDRERVRTMLTRFQASQRAGRAAAQAPRGVTPTQEEA
jgi:signal transduction histidine kinase